MKLYIKKKIVRFPIRNMVNNNKQRFQQREEFYVSQAEHNKYQSNFLIETLEQLISSEKELNLLKEILLNKE